MNLLAENSFVSSNINLALHKSGPHSTLHILRVIAHPPTIFFSFHTQLAALLFIYNHISPYLPSHPNLL